MTPCCISLDGRTDVDVTIFVVQIAQYSPMGSRHHVLLTKEAFKKLIVASGILPELLIEQAEQLS